MRAECWAKLIGTIGTGGCFFCRKEYRVLLSGPAIGGEGDGNAPVIPFRLDEDPEVLWSRCPHCGRPQAVPD